MLTHGKKSVVRPETQNKSRHAIVIGSGFGGLAVAARLGTKGYRVTVLEKLDGPGGRAYVFKSKGFTFDTGPTIVTAPHLLDELWADCGKVLADDIELKSLHPFYDVRFDDGTVFTYSGNADEMRQQISALSPEDVAGYDAFMAHCEKCYDYGFVELANVSYNTFGSMVRSTPKIVQLVGLRTVYGMVSKFIKHPKLRTALSLHPLLIGGNPFSVTAMYCLINYLEKKGGVHFVMGGTGELVKGMVGLIQGHGDTIRYNSEVAEILVENGRSTGVRLHDGETMKADIVVCNADAAWSYENLLPKQKRRRWKSQKLARLRYSMGLFVWYFGTDRKFPDVRHHSMIMGARYRGLLKDIFSNKTLSEDFSLYLHRPTATDPALAPPGCDTFYALVPVPHLDAGVDWARHGETFRAAVQQRLEDTVMPGLGDSIVTSHFVTPQDFETRLNSYKGAGFGPEPVLWQSAWFRPHNNSEEVEGLYMVGASTHPGAGIPGVVTSARVVSKLIPDAHELV